MSGEAGGRDKVIGDRFRRKKANSSTVPETVGTAFREGRKSVAGGSGRIPDSYRDETRPHWLPRWRSVTPVGRLNNMVRRHRGLPLPAYLPTFGVPRLIRRRFLPHACIPYPAATRSLCYPHIRVTLTLRDTGRPKFLHQHVAETKKVALDTAKSSRSLRFEKGCIVKKRRNLIRQSLNFCVSLKNNYFRLETRLIFSLVAHFYNIHLYSQLSRSRCTRKINDVSSLKCLEYFFVTTIRLYPTRNRS